MFLNHDLTLLIVGTSDGNIMVLYYINEIHSKPKIYIIKLLFIQYLLKKT